jgi:hypothetical protein
MDDIKTDVFLSHRQLTGQKIALALFEQLTSKHHKKVFLDVRVDFDLHNLERLVEETKNFVFILSEGIFDSKYCLQGEESTDTILISSCRVQKSNGTSETYHCPPRSRIQLQHSSYRLEGW